MGHASTVMGDFSLARFDDEELVGEGSLDDQLGTGRHVHFVGPACDSGCGPSWKGARRAAMT